MHTNKQATDIPTKSGVARLWPIQRGLKWLWLSAIVQLLAAASIYFGTDHHTLSDLADGFLANTWLILFGNAILMLILFRMFSEFRKRDLLIRELLAELETRGVIGSGK